MKCEIQASWKNLNVLCDYKKCIKCLYLESLLRRLHDRLERINSYNDCVLRSTLAKKIAFANIFGQPFSDYTY